MAAFMLMLAILVPGFTPAGTGTAGGTLWAGTFPGGPVRPSYVYLPPGFTTSTRYPVVYLLHGMPGDPSEYVDSLRLADLADGLIASGRVRPFIAVVPAAGPAHYNGEWAGPWERYLVTQVVPWVDANLPTIPTAQGRTIAGLSAGGFGAVDIGLRNPGLFGTIESWSGYFKPFLDGPFVHSSKSWLEWNTPTVVVRRHALLLAAAGTRFFLSTGPGHGHIKSADTLAFDEQVAALGLTQQYWQYPHKKGMYESQLEAGLLYALAP